MNQELRCRLATYPHLCLARLEAIGCRVILMLLYIKEET